MAKSKNPRAGKTFKKSPVHTYFRTAVVSELEIWRKRNPKRFLPSFVLESAALIDRLKGLSNETKQKAKVNLAKLAFITSIHSDYKANGTITVREHILLNKTFLVQLENYIERKRDAFGEAKVGQLIEFGEQIKEIQKQLQSHSPNERVHPDPRLLDYAVTLNETELRDLIGQAKFSTFKKAQQQAYRLVTKKK